MSPATLLSSAEVRAFTAPTIINLVGRKAHGLSLFPPSWCPPFSVLTSLAYGSWAKGGEASRLVLSQAAVAIESISRAWRQHWPRGLILRSSADTETLEDRGANQSLRLVADFDAVHIEEALRSIFHAFTGRAASGQLAVIVQPLASERSMGHLSNERRVSKTVNQWHWERLSPDTDQGRVNSQRDHIPKMSASLSAQPKGLVRLFGSVGKWVTGLGHGPAHLEWIYDGQTLWLLQIDFENDWPDNGINPQLWLREADHAPSGELPLNSILTAVCLDPSELPNTWRKIENVKQFAVSRPDPFPPIVQIVGDRFLRAFANNRKALETELETFAHGRVVCRTDCKTDGVSRENLPRTNTVSSKSAVDHMQKFLDRMGKVGAPASDVCFLAHKFIPARSGAWASADPGSTIVRVDALWGVPDGLQYLPHDTFDVDIRMRSLIAERLRYKPRFIQECSDGSWQELKVRRALGRRQSLSAADAVEVAIASHEIASRAGKPLLIMWFCGIPSILDIGTNLPWFSMPPNRTSTLVGNTISPRWPRTVLRSMADVEAAHISGVARTILVLEPEIVLFRDEKFLADVISLAKRDNCPVQLAGSSLAHAHYQLEKSGVTVVPADGPTRSRVRGRRSFSKLVRDEVPSQIAGRGEMVAQSRLPRSEMRRALAAKLIEEMHELLSATDPDDVKGELADLLEVVRAMASVTGVDWSDVETVAEEKRRRRGGFEDGAVLVETEWPASDRRINRAPPMVTLRGIGKVQSAGRGRVVSYNALLASSNGVDIELDSLTIRMSLSRDGVSLMNEKVAAASDFQLVLELEDNTK